MVWHNGHLSLQTYGIVEQ